MENIIQLQAHKRESLDLYGLMNKLNRLEFQLLKLNSIIKEKEKSIIQIHNSDGIHFIRTKDIIYVKAEGNYSRVFIKDASPLLVSKTLKHLSNTLPEYGFIRTHQSYLINPHHILRVLKKGGFQILMCNLTSIPVSRSEKPKIIDLLKIALI